MRSLASAALGEGPEGVPAQWLETVRRVSASFAKYQSLMISEYEKGRKPKVSLSERERGILSDLCNGLSRAEIAVKESLSVNTVNSAVNNIFSKLGARGIVDAVRIAAEEKLVPPFR
jgi:DNA-binding NarL/FixJ family response regulator